MIGRGEIPAPTARRRPAPAAQAPTRPASVRNCPQAARMSRPRGVRTGDENPASITTAANRAIAEAVEVS